MRDGRNTHKGYECAPERQKEPEGATAIVTFGSWVNPPVGGWVANMWMKWTAQGEYRLWSWTNTTAQDYALFAEVIDAIRAYDEEGMSPMQFCQLLERLGYQDEFDWFLPRDGAKTDPCKGKRAHSQTRNRPRSMFPIPIEADPAHQEMILRLIDRLYRVEKRDAVAVPDLLEAMNASGMSPEQFDKAIAALMESGSLTIGVHGCGYGNIVLPSHGSADALTDLADLPDPLWEAE